jgi:hypothetical protein
MNGELYRWRAVGSVIAFIAFLRQATFSARKCVVVQRSRWPRPKKDFNAEATEFLFSKKPRVASAFSEWYPRGFFSVASAGLSELCVKALITFFARHKEV